MNTFWVVFTLKWLKFNHFGAQKITKNAKKTHYRQKFSLESLFFGEKWLLGHRLNYFFGFTQLLHLNCRFWADLERNGENLRGGGLPLKMQEIHLTAGTIFISFKVSFHGICLWSKCNHYVNLQLWTHFG